MQAKPSAYPRPFSKPRNYFLMLGTLILLLVVFIPIFDAMRLMKDPTFVFFMGRSMPMRIIWTCLGSVVLYMFLIVLFFACAREEAKTDQSILMIFSIVLTALGVGLLSLSVPLTAATLDVHNEIFSNCQFGPRTQRLYEYSTVLQGLRSAEPCASFSSVNMCDGYQESMPYTGFLSSMEGQYGCSGFCYGNSTMAAATAAVQAEPVVINPLGTTLAPTAIQAATGAAVAVGTAAATAGGIPIPGASTAVSLRAGRMRSNELTGALKDFVAHQQAGLAPEAPPALLQTNSSEAGGKEKFPHDKAVSAHTYAGFSETFDRVPGPIAIVTAAPNATRDQIGRTTVYPPTLFSTNNNQVSCDGMAARDLKFQAGNTSHLIFFEGCFLLFAVALGALAKTCDMCIQVPKGKLSRAAA